MSHRLQRKDVPVELVLAYAEMWWNLPASGGVVHRLEADGFPPKVALAKVEQLNDLGLLECGTTPYFSWPSREGIALLRKLEGAP